MNCELCGTPVRVVGNTTKHYEPVEDARIKALEDALELYGDKDRWVDGRFVEAKAYSNKKHEFVAITDASIPPWSRAKNALASYRGDA